MSVLDLAALAFASAAVVDVWKNSVLFAGWRAAAEMRADLPDRLQGSSDLVEEGADEPAQSSWPQRVLDHLPRWFSELLCCSYCLSYHVPWILLATTSAALWFGATNLYTVLQGTIYSLAATRIGWHLQALLTPNYRYDRD